MNDILCCCLSQKHSDIFGFPNISHQFWRITPFLREFITPNLQKAIGNVQREKNVGNIFAELTVNCSWVHCGVAFGPFMFYWNCWYLTQDGSTTMVYYWPFRISSQITHSVRRVFCFELQCIYNYIEFPVIKADKALSISKIGLMYVMLSCAFLHGYFHSFLWLNFSNVIHHNCGLRRDFNSSWQL